MLEWGVKARSIGQRGSGLAAAGQVGYVEMPGM